MHTPGPMKQADRFLYTLNKDGTNRIHINVSGGFVRQPKNNDAGRVHTSEAEERDTTDLLAAAYTSYDKHFGPNAIEAALEDAFRGSH